MRMRMRMRGLSMISDVKEEAEKFLNMEPKPRHLGLEHINNNHFVVLVKSRDDFAPAVGLRS